MATSELEPVVVLLTVRRFDLHGGTSEFDIPTCSKPVRVEIPHDLNFIEIRSLIKKSIGLEEDGEEVLKLRRHDGALITYSYLLNGPFSSEPYFLDVSRLSQCGSLLSRPALPPSCATTVQDKLASLVKRVERMESLAPDMRTHRTARLEETLNQMATKVSFLDRRLDELMPQEWKKHMPESPA